MEAWVSRKRVADMSETLVETATLEPGPPPIEAPTLAQLLLDLADRPPTTWDECKVLVVDCRRILDYNTSHIRSAVNICCSKLVRRRLQENKMSGVEVLMQQLHACGFGGKPRVGSLNVVLYDHQPFDLSKAKSEVRSSKCARKAWSCRAETDGAPFVHFLLNKLASSSQLASVTFLKGGFMEFESQYPELCEGAAPAGGVAATPGRGASARLSLSSLSQPCLPATNLGPTRILPFLYLGSQQDALDQSLLSRHSIGNVLNLSNSCPRPDFLPEAAFLRIPVNDSYSEKLLPHFDAAFAFLDQVRASNGSVLIHCLAGISRSPSLAIAYIMRHLHMTSDEAYRYIKEKRPSISPNFNFLGQLLEYEKLLTAERGQTVARQLRATNRRVLVPVLSTGPLSARHPADPKDTPPPTPGISLRRCFSCPVNMAARLQEPAEPTKSVERSDSSVQAPSPVSSVPDTAPPPERIEVGRGPALVSRPFDLGALTSRRCLRIPSAVPEDLPSPSTELSKLNFGMPGPGSGDVMEEEAFHTPPEQCPKASPESAFEDLSTPTSETCVANPFFSVIATCSPKARTTAAPAQAPTASPPVTQQPPSASSTSAENPFFTASSSTASARSIGKRHLDSARAGGSKKPTLEQRAGRSMAARIGNLLRKATWNPVVPLFGQAPLPSKGGSSGLSGGFLSGYFANSQQQPGGFLSRSRTTHSIPLSLGVGKSMSETGLVGRAEVVESPESGFAESPGEAGAARHDPDLDSLSSASSLEIPVN